MRLIIYGAGGHSREIAEILLDAGHEIVAFVDDVAQGVHSPTELPVLPLSDVPDGVEGFVVAIGDANARRRVFEELSARWTAVDVRAQSAQVSRWAQVGTGVQVTQNVVINARAVVGDDVILNVGCVVSHDVTVGSHTHVAPGVLLGGGSSVGERCLIGAGAVVLPTVSVGDDCVVGAGAVVASDVGAGSTVVGVPARAVGT